MYVYMMQACRLQSKSLSRMERVIAAAKQQKAAVVLGNGHLQTRMSPRLAEAFYKRRLVGSWGPREQKVSRSVHLGSYRSGLSVMPEERAKPPTTHPPIPKQQDQAPPLRARGDNCATSIFNQPVDALTEGGRVILSSPTPVRSGLGVMPEPATTQNLCHPPRQRRGPWPQPGEAWKK
jgi:hypothetical protein